MTWNIALEELLTVIKSRSFQLLSHVWLFVTSWTAAHQAFLSITNSRSLLKLMSIELVMPSSHLFLCHPLLLLPSVFPSIRVFSSESVLIDWEQINSKFSLTKNRSICLLLLRYVFTSHHTCGLPWSHMILSIYLIVNIHQSCQNLPTNLLFHCFWSIGANFRYPSRFSERSVSWNLISKPSMYFRCVCSHLF